MTKIISNKIQCLECKDIIESKHVHDFVSCSCGLVAADGGKDYLRRIGNPIFYKDLSETIEGPDKICTCDSQEDKYCFKCCAWIKNVS